MGTSYLRKLKSRLYEEDITQIEIAERLKRSNTYVMQRMTGRRSWSVDEAYLILDMVGEPCGALIDYFPRRMQETKKTVRI